jgi:hypothetical protein
LGQDAPDGQVLSGRPQPRPRLKPALSVATPPRGGELILLAAVQVRYPTVPIAFCETRTLAGEWTYRYLVAALKFAEAERDHEDPDSG